MQIFLPESLQNLASKLPQPLYIVGGTVRDHLAGFTQKNDFDLASSILSEDFCKFVTACNLHIKAIYKHTGTVQFTDGNYTFEYTTFRQDSYKRGEHTPTAVKFTDKLEVDALRRDFTCNALYYDIMADKILDPCGSGRVDIENKLLKTTRDAEEVFAEDGLRLMRLARFAATLGFEADLSTIFAAKFNAARIQQIVPERIFAEFQAILQADSKNNIADAHYIGLKILEGTDILNYILPELMLGQGMAQRTDFHAHDVLEHSLRSCKYAHPTVRLAALLHDIGKPKQKIETGKFRGHDQVGALLVEQILTRWKAPKALLKECSTLTALHMFDLDGSATTESVRAFFVENFTYLQKLFYLRQADFSAAKDIYTPCPTVEKWQTILHEMQAEGVPFSLKGLQIDGNTIQSLVKNKQNIGKILDMLLQFCAQDVNKNQPDILLQQAKVIAKTLE